MVSQESHVLAAGHPAAGPSHVQLVRPRRCAAAGAPPGPAAATGGARLLRENDRILDSGPRLHREVFSPGTGAQLEGVVVAAGQGCGESLADSITAPRRVLLP